MIYNSLYALTTGDLVRRDRDQFCTRKNPCFSWGSEVEPWSQCPWEGLIAVLISTQMSGLGGNQGAGKHQDLAARLGFLAQGSSHITQGLQAIFSGDSCYGKRHKKCLWAGMFLCARQPQ